MLQIEHTKSKTIAIEYFILNIYNIYPLIFQACIFQSTENWPGNR